MLTYPQIDPVAVNLGPLQIHWYALSYIAGFLLGWGWAVILSKKYPAGTRPNADDIGDFLSWVILGILLGGRLGYVVFYNLDFYLDHLSEIPQVWDGGMSFHGGVIGVVITLFVYSRIKKINMLRLADLSACSAPIGFFLGRLANFVNGELYGRVTDGPWGMVFPRGGDEPRHPSQLYEAALEGVLLFVILAVMAQFKAVRDRPGILSMVFMFGYATFRFIVEFAREPDAQLGFIVGHLSMGQLLSSLMVVCGLIIFVLVVKGRTQDGQSA
ncbi:MAG: prolipoprotein diacylglyceryl transferase [Pseudobdellovibrionaceae bacterium]